jgi:hypothetical protein
MLARRIQTLPEIKRILDEYDISEPAVMSWMSRDSLYLDTEEYTDSIIYACAECISERSHRESDEDVLLIYLKLKAECWKLTAENLNT